MDKFEFHSKLYCCIGVTPFDLCIVPSFLTLYAHTTVKATFDWEVSLDFDKIGMSISFIPQPRTTIIAEGHATFWYNSQDFEVAPNV